MIATARVSTPVPQWLEVALGLPLCCAVTPAAIGLEKAEHALWHHAWLEALVLAILPGTALGLGTDLRAMAGAGPRVTAAVCLSLLVLGGMSVALIRLPGIA
jgi:uncharacterized membrane protein YadS